MLFTITELQILLGLAEGHTQVEIGAQLHLDQPTISKLLRAAERKVGLPLAEQRGRRLRLTPVGTELAHGAAAVIAQLRALEQLVASLRAGSSGPVQIVATSTPGAYVLPPIIGEFQRAFPAARVDLEIVPAHHIWETLADTSYEFAVGPQMNHPDDLEVEPLYDDPIVLFVAPTLALAGRRRVRWSDLSPWPLIGNFVAVNWTHLFQALDRRGVERLERINIPSVEGVKRLVATGAGVGALLESSVREEFALGTLRRLPIKDPALAQSIYLIQRRGVRLTPMGRQFRDFLIARVAQPDVGPRPAKPAVAAR
jgi:DNA-binding transcriptional LysR family regulator